MQTNWRSYDVAASSTRIKDILNASDVNYEEVDALPSRDKLTFSNGFYANCAALFVDIRKSSELPAKYKRPTLARLYRAYISEVVAIMNADSTCQEVNVVGDGAWAVFKTPLKTDIDGVFSTAARINSMKHILNYHLGKRGIDAIQIGLGMEYGRALMVKAGLSGSGINEVVYMGDVVNRAAKLAADGNQTWSDGTLMVGGVFQNNLNDHNKGLLTYNYGRGAYTGDVINTAMEEWRRENCT